MIKDRFKSRVWQESSKHMGYDNCFIVYPDGSTDMQLHRQDGSITLLRGEHGFTLMQCIGLKDKDGKLIYEKDILEDINFPKKYYKVVFDNDTCQHKFLQIKDNYQLITTSKKYCENYLKVIGNIYENKELLEE